MFAVVEIKGFQEKVTQGQKLSIPHLADEAGAVVVFDKVMMIVKDADITVGAPYIAGASIEVKVLEHTRGDKIRVVKHRRRKRYRRVKGHRQDYTEVEVTKIVC